MELYHYGTPHKSGRYKWGSGENPYQHPYIEKGKGGFYKQNEEFYAEFQKYHKAGLSDNEIADKMGYTVNEFRSRKTWAVAQNDAALRARCRRLAEHNPGLSNREIGQILFPDDPVGESTVRNWRKEVEETKLQRLTNTANAIENKLRKGEYVNITSGAELDLGVTKTMFDTAVLSLKEKGYHVGIINIPQPNSPDKNTTIKIIAPKGTTDKELWLNRENIKPITEFLPEAGLKKAELPEYPSSIDSKRIKIVYADEKTPDGTGYGIDKDGLIEIRRNVDDLKIGNHNALYGQVRIMVDNKYFAKGMAIYSDNIPDGYDMVINSNKKTGAPLGGEGGVLKNLKDDPENPFKATLYAWGQNHYTDSDGNEKLGVINVLKEEGMWDASKKSLSSQFLSKQPTQLIERQLKLTYEKKSDMYDEIMTCTNPIVKEKLLKDFAEGCDKDAKHLNAAALPRQNTKVLIPVPSLNDNECYCPTYKDGEKLVLIRYPHAGTFEIPILTVNNKSKDAKALLGTSKDAIGISAKPATQLSGADYDGDFVLTIPVNDKVKVNYDKPRENLIKFSETFHEDYAKYPGMKVMTSKQKGIEMGKISNLITDMTAQHAPIDEVERAVKHSMVVIDAEKHELNWKLSEEVNGIDALKRKWQVQPDKKKGYGGAATLISKSEHEIDVLETKRSYKPNKDTGEWEYKETGKIVKQNVYKDGKDPDTGAKVKNMYRGFVNEKGDTVWIEKSTITKENRASFGTPLKKEKMATQKKVLMELTDDAYTLSSGTIQESYYADYANKMKALANKARKEAYYNIEKVKKDPSAAETYSKEVASLTANLNLALKNKPREQQAQIQANVAIEKYKKENPNVEKDKLKKEKNKIMSFARLNAGAGKEKVVVSKEEWKAIQANAVSPTTLSKILNNADMDVIKEHAFPKKNKVVSNAQISRMKALEGMGFTNAEIAEHLDLSVSTINKYL